MKLLLTNGVKQQLMEVQRQTAICQKKKKKQTRDHNFCRCKCLSCIVKYISSSAHRPCGRTQLTAVTLSKNECRAPLERQVSRGEVIPPQTHFPQKKKSSACASHLQSAIVPIVSLVTECSSRPRRRSKQFKHFQHSFGIL